MSPIEAAGALALIALFTAAGIPFALMEESHKAFRILLVITVALVSPLIFRLFTLAILG